MFTWTSIAAFALGILGYILNFFDKEKNSRIYRIIAVVLLLLFVFVYWNERDASSEQQEKAQIKIDSLVIKTDLSSAKIDSLKEDQDSLKAQLQTFIEMASIAFPNLPSSAALHKLAEILPELMKGVHRIQPKLLRLEKEMQKSFDPQSGMHSLIYVFRSQSGYLGDIRIEMTFNHDIDTAFHKIGGLSGRSIVYESGSRFTFRRDHKGFVFETKELHEGNDIIIKILSSNEIELNYESLQP